MAALRYLSACYQCLSATTPFAADRLAEHCKRCAALYVALEHVTDGVFRTKPKLHMFQEFCEMSFPGRPASAWTYRDEEFGGVLVGTARRRGGQREHQAPPATLCSGSLLLAFMCPTCVERFCTAMGRKTHRLAHTHRQKRLPRIVTHEMTDTGLNRASP